MLNLNTTKKKRNGTEEIFKIVITKNFSKLMTDIKSHIQESQRIAHVWQLEWIKIPTLPIFPLPQYSHNLHGRDCCQNCSDPLREKHPVSQGCSQGKCYAKLAGFFSSKGFDSLTYLISIGLNLFPKGMIKVTNQLGSLPYNPGKYIIIYPLRVSPLIPVMSPLKVILFQGLFFPRGSSSGSCSSILAKLPKFDIQWTGVLFPHRKLLAST